MMKWLLSMLLVALMGFGLSAPAAADPVLLNDSEEPGSILVFHKFIRGKVQIGNASGTALFEPKSAFEISLVCPTALVNPNTGRCTLAEGTAVKLLAHWVCPGEKPPFGTGQCPEVNFNLRVTLGGTVWINPENVGSRTTNVSSRPPCPEGYLIVWAVDSTDRPIRFDGLIGNAVLRHAPGSAGAYNALPIQAVPGTHNAVLGDGNVLNLDGFSMYKAVTGMVQGTARAEVTFPSPGLGRIETDLTLLTLDVLSNRQNFPVVVDLDIYNENEVLKSTATEFTCWTERRITAIDPDLDEFFGRKLVITSTQAVKTPVFGIDDYAGPVTLLGVITTRERNVGGGIAREYSYSMYHNSTPVPTVFVP
jgi:hypothetical protein